jgi:hypothetical protein
MRVQRIGSEKRASLLRTRDLWLCSLAGLFVIALVVHPLQHQSFAQSPSSQAGAVPGAANPGGKASAQAPDAQQQAKQEVKADPDAERRKQISDESADLVKLANSLKAEMDKTTKDELSLAVIRKATEIEQLAHKMRTK